MEYTKKEYKEVLIERFADAKYKTQTYDGESSLYWKGVRDGYHSVLNLLFPGWGNVGRGKEVWVCADSDEEVLLNKTIKQSN